MLKWEAEHGCPFLVEGVALDDFIQRQWTAYEEQKVKEKEQRVSNPLALHRKELKSFCEPILFRAWSSCWSLVSAFTCRLHPLFVYTFCFSLTAQGQGPPYGGGDDLRQQAVYPRQEEVPDHPHKDALQAPQGQQFPVWCNNCKRV